MTYENWTERQKSLRLSHYFGRNLMAHAYQYAKDRIPQNASNEEKVVAEKAIRDTLYGVMMILDGVAVTYSTKDDPHMGDKNRVEFTLIARVINDDLGEVIDEVEIASSGEGLCMGIHGWLEDNFGDT